MIAALAIRPTRPTIREMVTVQFLALGCEWTVEGAVRFDADGEQVRIDEAYARGQWFMGAAFESKLMRVELERLHEAMIKSAGGQGR